MKTAPLLARCSRVFALALLPAATALAHPGAPGHSHPELPLAVQAAHAAMNWAPVLVLAVVGAWGVLRGKRRDA